MIITQSDILFSSNHQASQQYHVTESLIEGFSQVGEVWSADNLIEGVVYHRAETIEINNGVQEKPFPNKSPDSQQIQNLRDTALSIEAKPTAQAAIGKTEPIEEDSLITIDSKLLLLKAIIEKLTGHKIQLHAIKQEEPDVVVSINYESAEASEISETNINSSTAQWGMIYNFQETYSESESSQFNVNASITTATGKQISLNINLDMERSFSTSESLRITGGAAPVDPLVINFSGHVQLTDNKYQFDLDNNGSQDSISFVGSNSGFLAFDKNNNQIIDNGSELFGTITGNGFNELAAYDEDGNHFIDEADSIYNQLLIWTKDSEGNDSYHSLADKNVGAIHLGYVDTPFELKNEQQELQGIVRSTGLYLSEDGGSGTVQQVDLVI